MESHRLQLLVARNAAVLNRVSARIATSKISPDFKRPGPMNARIQVEYCAASPGFVQIQFDGSSRQYPHYSNGGRINFDADGNWKTVNFQLNEAVFRNGEKGGADFRLTSSSPELYPRSVTVFFDQ